MSRGRKLQAGDEALTDFNGNGMTRVVIVDRLAPATSQSRVLFRVDPPLKGGSSSSWYDADWFEPAPQKSLRDMTETDFAEAHGQTPNTELTGARSASE